MSGTVELDADRRHLQIRFQYREDLVAEVKALPQRRWDPAGKVWRVPIAHAEAVYDRFARHLFSFAPEVMSLVAGTLGTAPAPATAAHTATGPVPAPVQPAAPDDAPAALTVADLNLQVRSALRDRFPTPVWVVGEILDFDKTEGRRARFFKLVDKREGEARPRATVDAALFENTMRRLLPALAAAPEPLSLRDGIEIRALVRVDLYPEQGQFRVVVEDVDASFTLGRLALDRERILRALREAGLDRLNRDRPLPPLPLRIGVLTSPDSDGWNDFLRHLQESGFGFQVTLVPIRVQGAGLKRGLLAGLDWFAARADQHDLLCIIRGGGSRTDLAWFDDLDLATAVARHPLKLLVGIGHQRDRSVLDEIAHSEKTPTAVAARLVLCLQGATDGLREQAARLGRCARDALREAGDLLRDRAARVDGATRNRLVGARERLAQAAERLLRESRRALRHARTALTANAASLGRLATTAVQRERAALDARGHLLRRGAALAVERAGAALRGRADRLRLLDPRAVLQRGFALIRRDRRVITDAGQLAAGQPIQVQLRDGTVDARTQSISLDAKP